MKKNQEGTDSESNLIAVPINKVDQLKATKSKLLKNYKAVVEMGLPPEQLDPITEKAVKDLAVLLLDIVKEGGGLQ